MPLLLGLLNFIIIIIYFVQIILHQSLCVIVVVVLLFSISLLHFYPRRENRIVKEVTTCNSANTTNEPIFLFSYQQYTFLLSLEFIYFSLFFFFYSIFFITSNTLMYFQPASICDAFITVYLLYHSKQDKLRMKFRLFFIIIFDMTMWFTLRFL